jgi:hypothetical protein
VILQSPPKIRGVVFDVEARSEEIVAYTLCITSKTTFSLRTPLMRGCAVYGTDDFSAQRDEVLYPDVESFEGRPWLIRADGALDWPPQ